MALCEQLTNIFQLSLILFDIKAKEQKLFLSAKKSTKFSLNWFQQDLETLVIFECRVRWNGNRQNDHKKRDLVQHYFLTKIQHLNCKVLPEKYL